MSKLKADDIQKKMKIAEALFNMAYATKRFQLKKKHPSWSEEELHKKTMELIERGCA